MKGKEEELESTLESLLESLANPGGDLDQLKEQERSLQLDNNKVEELEEEALRTAVGMVKERLRKLKIKNNHAKEDQGQRKIFAGLLFNYLSYCTVAVFFILLCSGYRNNSFHLSDSVLVALVTTSLGHAVGVFVAVPRYLFSIKNKKKH